MEEKHFNFKDRTGEIYISNEGFKLTIIAYRGVNDCDIEFEDRGIIKNLTYHNIIKGSVNNPYHPIVYNMGYLGVGKYKSSINNIHSKSYKTWTDMLKRCYDPKYHIKKPTYKECWVHPVWCDFQFFAEWFEKNYVEGWHLDKDILKKGNTEYSDETCCFVPQEINGLFIKSNSRRGECPIGVTKRGKRFEATLSKDSKFVYLGTYDSIEEAFQAYKEAKEDYIKEVAIRWRKRIPNKVFESMIYYKVEITD